MSGGSFDYFCWNGGDGLDKCVNAPRSMAQSIRDSLANPESRVHTDRERGWRPLEPGERLELEEAAVLLDALSDMFRAAKLMFQRHEDLFHAVEWCMSGDTGLDDIMRAYRKLTRPMGDK